MSGSKNVVRRATHVSGITEVKGEQVPVDEWYYDGDTVKPEHRHLITNPKVFIPEGEEESSDDGLFEEPSEGQPVNYSGLNKSELEQLCDERNIDKVGTKPELIERLKASDGASS